MIPKLIHQTWKTNVIPDKWIPLVNKVKELNPDWSYRLWTDNENDEFVRNEFPEFYRIFSVFPIGIMKADVIRYLLMYRFGGVYLDLDYEVLKPFYFGDKLVVLPLEEKVSEHDPLKKVGNCFIASVPGHRFWQDVISDLQFNPPQVKDHTQVLKATGPWFLSRIYNQKYYPDIYTPDRSVYIPLLLNKKKDIESARNNDISLGIHHGWGTWRKSTWKDRLTIWHIKRKLKMIMDVLKKKSRHTAGSKF